MFEHLARWARIVVTGPQRSGTTICAQMIAMDTGHAFIDEVEFSVYDHGCFARLLERERIVVQAPSMFTWILDNPGGLYVVLVRRPLEEIHASEHRIGWGVWEPTERLLLGTQDRAAETKYARWERSKPRDYLEVEYLSLRDHPLWVQDRAGWANKQTTPCG